MSGKRVPLADRFWPKVDKRGADECWLWTASRRQYGYGQIGGGGEKSQPLKAHRVAWQLTYGPIPDGLHVLHRCDNPPCCNPAHLFLGTNADNVADMVRKGRIPSRAGENGGRAKLTEEQVKQIRTDRRAAKDVAAAYGVNRQTVSDIRAGKSWRHLGA